MEGYRPIPHSAIVTLLWAIRSDPENTQPCLLDLKNPVVCTHTHKKKDYSHSESIFSLLYKKEKLPTLIKAILHLTFSMENVHLSVMFAE